MKKALLLVIALGFCGNLFTTTGVRAQADARCWTESECVNARKAAFPSMSDDEAKMGHYTELEATSVCGKERSVGAAKEKMGFCLPAGQTVTGITFGGQNEFANIGEFIRFMYRYGIMIAGILSVVVIIIAGVQWTTSGGNSATIDSAKTRIGGALIGLILAVFSYFILYVINPQLVNFRLPQIWMIKTQEIQGNYCSDLKAGTKTVYYREDKAPVPPASKLKEDYKNKFTFDTDSSQVKCGQSHFIQGQNGLVCSGTICPNNHVCVRRQQDTTPQCSRGILSGNLMSSGDFFKDKSERVADNDIYLVALCNNGHTEFPEGGDTQKSADGTEFYVFSNQITDSVCDGDGGVMGFYLAVELNDETGLVGQGDDDFHAIGRTPGTKQCNVNLSKLAYQSIGESIDCRADSEDWRCGCEGIADLAAKENNRFKAIENNIKNFLITKEELTAPSGMICDISVNRDEFPDMDDTTDSGDCDE